MVSGSMKPGVIGVVHVHSNYSHDGRDPLEQVKEFAVDRGISFVGMTEHAEDFDPSRYVEYQEHCRSLSDATTRLIPGLEYRFAGHPGLHLLALGLGKMIRPRTPDDFCLLAAGNAQFTIVAHPVLCDYQVPEAVANAIDAIEVWNASYNTRFLPDSRAIRLFLDLHRRRPEVVAIAGLDQHDSRNDRETRVVLSDPAAQDPLGELKAGKFTNYGRTMSFDAHASMNPGRLAVLSVARWSLDRVNSVEWSPGRSRRFCGDARERSSSGAPGHPELELWRHGTIAGRHRSTGRPLPVRVPRSCAGLFRPICRGTRGSRVPPPIAPTSRLLPGLAGAPD